MREQAERILKAEADAISAIPLTDAFEKAVCLLVECRGKLIATGIGKAGYIAQKAASTFCTTGTPASFLHPGDASHGDVGVIGPNDIVLAFSNSGKTREVLETIGFCRNLGLETVFAITSHPDSPLGQVSDVVLEIGHIEEACPLGLTPSASTTAMLALADALALVTMEARGFTRKEFSLRHHGGYLGEKSRL